ncbi:MAG: extensin family protein [Alphaproteobacteria bacterium]
MQVGGKAVVLSLMLTVVACGPQRPSPQIASLTTGDQAIATDAVYAVGGSCQELLRARGATFEMSEPFHTDRGCGIDEPVMLRTGVAELGPDAELECAMALKWLDFDQRVIQPLAHEHFDQGVAYIHQMSGYSCRTSTGNRRKLSQHSYGLALDIGAFELPDGRQVSVERDYFSDNDEGRFMRAVAERACGFFSTVLTPNSDRHHHNHFHLDLGNSGICSL